MNSTENVTEIRRPAQVSSEAAYKKTLTATFSGPAEEDPTHNDNVPVWITANGTQTGHGTR